LKSKITELAVLSSGVYAKADPDGEVFYIQARDITDDHQITEGIKPQLIDDGKLNKHFLQAGDLLVAAKGKDHYAIEYSGHPHPAVASTLFVVVRVTEKAKLVSSFLRWYLNLDSTQRLIAGGAQGSALPVISKADLEQIEVPVPPLEKQVAILKIEELRQREIDIIHQIELLKRKKIEQELLIALSH
jgi:restriction endonuclease S subunit